MSGNAFHHTTDGVTPWPSPEDRDAWRNKPCKIKPRTKAEKKFVELGGRLDDRRFGKGADRISDGDLAHEVKTTQATLRLAADPKVVGKARGRIPGTGNSGRLSMMVVESQWIVRILNPCPPQ